MRAISNLLAHVILVVSSPIWVTVTKPQLSLTVTPPVKIGGTSLAHSTDTLDGQMMEGGAVSSMAVSYTHLRAHETVLDIVCRLLLEKKKKHKTLNRRQFPQK